MHLVFKKLLLNLKGIYFCLFILFVKVLIFTKFFFGTVLYVRLALVIVLGEVFYALLV